MEHALLFIPAAPSAVELLRGSNLSCCGRRASLRKRAAIVSMATVKKDDPPATFEEYVKARNRGGLHGGTMADASKGMMDFIAGGGDMEFDGGDSGGGVVGDGNCDLEDQHNSTEFLREGFTKNEFGKEGEDGEPIEDQTEKIGKVESAMQSRIASAGQNYWGRSTGYAEEKIKTITEYERNHHRMDEVRAQQLENWFNQRAIHETRRQRQDTEIFSKPYAPTNYKDVISKKEEGPARRRDGKEWGELAYDESEIEATYEVKGKLDTPFVTELQVQNPYIRFMPYRVAFAEGSHSAFTVEPVSGTMERRSGKPVELIVRYTPRALEGESVAILVFETEEFKYVYKFIGST